jgi:hypothetical protein
MPLTRLLRGKVKQGHLLLAWIALFTCATAYSVYSNRQLGRQGEEAHDALCVFKGNLDARAKIGEDYVADVKAGRRPVLTGFTVAELERSAASQRAAVNSLRTLDCLKEAP